MSVNNSDHSLCYLSNNFFNRFNDVFKNSLLDFDCSISRLLDSYADGFQFLLSSQQHYSISVSSVLTRQAWYSRLLLCRLVLEITLKKNLKVSTEKIVFVSYCTDWVMTGLLEPIVVMGWQLPVVNSACGTVAQWLALSSDGEKIPGFISQFGHGTFLYGVCISLWWA